MAGPESAGVITRPSVAKMSSASSATAAIAAARSALNLRRSARRLAVISSEVTSLNFTPPGKGKETLVEVGCEKAGDTHVFHLIFED